MDGFSVFSKDLNIDRPSSGPREVLLRWLNCGNSMMFKYVCRIQKLKMLDFQPHSIGTVEDICPLLTLN